VTPLPNEARNTYLTDIPLDEALNQLHRALQDTNRGNALSDETISIKDALGRVTSTSVWAKRNAPHYHAAAMDGYALTAADTLDATETRPKQLEIGTRAFPVNTGEPIPPQANAVVMIEHVQHTSDEMIEVNAPIAPWRHVRMMGEDMVATELVIPANHRIRPVDIGAIAGCGHHTVNVRRKPHIALIPTGSELVTADQEPKPGQIIEYNSMVLSAQIEERGGIASVTPITPDDENALKQRLTETLAQQPDLVLILSGSSAGSKDFTASIISSMGDLRVHGVAVRPGHPVIIGAVDNVPIIGVPGYPVSAALTGEIFIQPLIDRWLGLPNQDDIRPTLTAKMTRKLLSPTGDDDYVRVTVAKVGDSYLAAPISKGAGVITSLVRADGIAHIPRFSEGLNIGDPVDVKLYRSLPEINRAILAMGSHDPMLDLLSQYLAASDGTRLISANVGSMGGLVALKRGEAHVAGTHLLDENSGEYNIPYIQKQLRNTPLSLVTFAHREQGLIVPKGNPKNILGINDLPGLSYVNRQRGAGTRLLLDYELKRHGMASDTIEGYTREEYTHLAVAAAVAAGTADCGLGVRSAALALDLDFVPVSWERFDLIIPHTHADHPGVRAILNLLTDDNFRQDLADQPGYRTDQTGQLQYEQSAD
jgi:putative molybdopterin biosynthesis protein